MKYSRQKEKKAENIRHIQDPPNPAGEKGREWLG